MLTRGPRGSSVVSVLSPLVAQRRHITRLYTSFYKGELFPNQMVQSKQRGANFRQVLRSGYGKQSATATTEATSAEQQRDVPNWKDASSTDVMTVNVNKNGNISEHQAAPKRPYVPLQEAAELELKGDYCMEGGMFQEALQHYGVVATLYNVAYPENHSQRAGIAIKLGSAFRATGKLDSSKANLEGALYMLDQSQRPSLELICECLMELGLTAEAAGDANAGNIFEDVYAAVEAFHSSGESHRMLRLLPRLGRRFVLNVEQKFIYFSPFDYDRTFAIADESLSLAEQFYMKHDNAEGVVRVLTARKQMIDKKFFNMRDFAGKIRTMRGHWMRRARVLTNAPTPEELLMYSPTIHQVHRDFRFENNAPLGYEGEVTPGVNRVVLDDGNAKRRQRTVSQVDVFQAGGSVKKAEARKRWE